MLARGVDGWREHIARAEPGHIWRTRHILGGFDLTVPKGRDDARVELVEYARTAQEHERDDIANLAAGSLQMDAGTLRRYLSGDAFDPSPGSAIVFSQPSGHPVDPGHRPYNVSGWP